ncbi:hypothetical protein A1O3_02999 [Capronia epimyces CBS 606.96]|uniref:Uncharacterized protein n=1 Tax=Capronia epimyces CBS 606.96 TaxID=1182542 RepID=W9YAR7_9EURO|nr:uncharacterized protein A1O3_02999 [Capronia epimyces CBS 606.96]EXJ89932.1 hypothetical protein A1O3_02999 [Capronia epimyces CBS 606.96]
MFLEWADRSSKMGFSIASLTLEIINSGHVCRSDQPHLQRGFNEIIVEAFRKLYHNTERIAGFSLSAELFPPPTTASEGFNSRSNKRASRLAHANGTLSTVWEPEAVRDKHKNQVASDVNTLNPFSGDTPLLGAARMGDLVAAKALLDAGADPSIAGKDGSVPLHWLFMFPKSNHEQIARHLGPADKAAATVHRRVKFPQRLDAQFPVELFGTPLSFAVATASLSAVEALLKIGASPTADAGIENSTSWHRSPLELAASLHLHTVLENLLRALGTTDLPDNLFLRLLGVMTESSIFERRCIHGAATATACQDTVSTICFYPETLPVKPDKTVDDLKAGISAAIARADTEVATALVDEFEAGFPHSANIQNRAQFIREAALLSAVNSHCANILDSSTTLELVNSAIEDRLDVERFNATRRAFDSQNPIFVAIENQRDDLLKFLKGKGIDICSKDPKGRSALHNIYINKLTWLSAKTIISLGFEVDERDDNSATPLYYAAMYGGPGEVKELVSMSAAVNACDDQGFTPLHQAIRGWDLPTIHCLLDLGADPTMFDKTGRAPIHLAAVDPRGLAIFKCLAHSGVSGEIKTKDGQDCIALASLSGNNLLVEEMITSELSGSPEKLRHPDVLVQQLVLRSSDALSISSCNGRAPLRYAARNGLENVVRLLRHILSSHNISKRDSSGRIALSLAAANGHTGVVKILFGLGPSSMIESTDEDGRGALSLAAGNGHVETVRELLKHTTKHNAQCRHGRTALSWAAGNGHTQVVAELLQAPRLDADSEGIYGRTPLSWAAGNGHAQVVAELLQVPRLDADSKGISDGRTPLSLAAGNGHIKVAKLLLESGRCTGDMTDRSGRSALSWAAGNGHLAMVEYLLSVPGSHREVWAADINGRSPVWWALRFSHTLIAKALVAQEYSKFQNRLLEAVQYGHLAVVEFLLDPRHLPHSYDVESRDARGRTALLVATEAGHSDIFFALMSVGRAKANVRDYQGRTPLYWAAKGGHLSMVKKLMLVLDPDDINWSASDGLTALSIARINGHVDVIAALSPDSGGVEPPPAQTTKITTTASATTHGTVDLDEKCDVKYAASSS